MAEVNPADLAEAGDAMLGSLIDLIEDHRAQLAAAFASQVGDGTPRLCSKKNHMGETCDRQPGHDEACSWELTQAIRRYRDAEVTASKVPALENKLKASDRRLAAAEAELEKYLSAHPNAR
jgi:hypothetical protein